MLREFEQDQYSFANALTQMIKNNQFGVFVDGNLQSISNITVNKKGVYLQIINSEQEKSCCKEEKQGIEKLASEELQDYIEGLNKILEFGKKLEKKDNKMSFDLKELNIFDVASAVMKFLQAGILVLEHEGNAVAPSGVNINAQGKVTLSSKIIQAVEAVDKVIEDPVVA